MKKFITALFCCFLAAVPAKAEQPLNVFAAASLKNALDDVAARFTKQQGTPVSLTYAASGALAKQIEAGAPADIYFSANRAWVNHLLEKELLDKLQTTNILGNALVLVAPKNSTAKASLVNNPDLLPLLNGSRLAIADTKAAPAGKYAMEAMEKLGMKEKLLPHIAEARNVRDALRLVAMGEAPLGIVYASDAVAEKRVRIVDTFPATSHKDIVYPVAVVKSSRHTDADNFASFVQTKEAAQIFLEYGFLVRHK